MNMILYLFQNSQVRTVYTYILCTNETIFSSSAEIYTKQKSKSFNCDRYLIKSEYLMNDITPKKSVAGSTKLNIVFVKFKYVLRIFRVPKKVQNKFMMRKLYLKEIIEFYIE